jgi:hypothetical protein
MAQCMRHAPLDVFTPSCLDMHGDILTSPFETISYHDDNMACCYISNNTPKNDASMTKVCCVLVLQLLSASEDMLLDDQAGEFYYAATHQFCVMPQNLRLTQHKYGKYAFLQPCDTLMLKINSNKSIRIFLVLQLKFCATRIGSERLRLNEGQRLGTSRSTVLVLPVEYCSLEREGESTDTCYLPWRSSLAEGERELYCDLLALE